MIGIRKAYYAYVIQSQEGYHYTGMTEDLEKRLLEYNEKRLSFWTTIKNFQLILILVI